MRNMISSGEGIFETRHRSGVVPLSGFGTAMERGSGRGAGSVRKWAVELSDAAPPSPRDVPDPLGFSRSSLDLEETTTGRQKKEVEVSWKQQKAWEVAQGPFRNLFMMGFMMWMAGSTVHLFSIGITFFCPLATYQCSSGCNQSYCWQCLVVIGLVVAGMYMYHSSLAALMGSNKLLVGHIVFEPFQDARTDTLLPKLLYIAMNLAGLGLGLWKLNTLGLLPTHASDWVSSLPPPQAVEFLWWWITFSLDAKFGSRFVRL